MKALKAILMSVLLTFSLLFVLSCADSTVTPKPEKTVEVYAALSQLSSMQTHEANGLKLEISMLGTPIPKLKQVEFDGKKADTLLTVPDKATVNAPNPLLNILACKNIESEEEIFKSKKIEIQTSFGKLIGKIKLPKKDSIIAPQMQSQVSVDKDLKVEWEGKADHYCVRLFKVEFKHGEPIFPLLYKKVTSEKNATISKDIINEFGLKYNGPPDFILMVNGFNGPEMKSKEKGNLEGDGNGYLISYYKQADLFETQIPPANMVWFNKSDIGKKIVDKIRSSAFPLIPSFEVSEIKSILNR